MPAMWHGQPNTWPTRCSSGSVCLQRKRHALDACETQLRTLSPSALGLVLSNGTCNAQAWRKPSTWFLPLPGTLTVALVMAFLQAV